MNKKVILWISVFMLNIAVAHAQTGLFDSATAGQFAVTGIIIVVIIIVIKEIFKQFFSKK